MEPVSIEQAERAGLVEHLIFDAPRTIMDTQYGRVTHHSWLQNEALRIMTDPERRVAFVIDAEGREALFVDNVGLNPEID